VTRWLITGAGGMLGRDLTGLLAAHGEQVTGLTRHDLDITDQGAVQAATETCKPDVIVNCAAWTAVDDAEAHEDEASRVNGHAVAGLAAACAAGGAALVQLSTDYVFDGAAGAPYAEHAPPAPRTAYGRSKLAGERAVLAGLPDSGYVVRTAWLYGAHGQNFVTTMIRLARSGAAPAVVDDQRGQPTWSLDVARQIHALIANGAPPGIYHATSSGETTWFGLAREVFTLLDAAPPPTPATSGAYRRPAPRPAYSVLGHDAWRAAGIPPIGAWRDALRRAFPALSGALVPQQSVLAACAVPVAASRRDALHSIPGTSPDKIGIS
jgi:dTDP-4-dehydrorhamnose reductase